jgi:hypothetical protein
VLGPTELKVAGAFFLGALVLYGIGMLVARRFFAARLDGQAFMGMSVTFGNTVQMGIPLVVLAYGSKGEGPLLAIITFHSLVLISLTTVLVEIGQNRGRGVLDTLRQSVAALATHPIIIAILAGILWGVSGLDLPLVVDRFLALAGSGAGALALLALGAGLNGMHLAGDLRESIGRPDEAGGAAGAGLAGGGQALRPAAARGRGRYHRGRHADRRQRLHPGPAL